MNSTVLALALLLPSLGCSTTTTASSNLDSDASITDVGTAQGAFPTAVGEIDEAGAAEHGVTQATVVFAGDIAQIGRTSQARANAKLVSSRVPSVSAVMLLGDNARCCTSTVSLFNYYRDYYAPASEANWGQFDSIAFPQLGNHEYFTGDPRGYFDYFAARLTKIKSLSSYSGFADDSIMAPKSWTGRSVRRFAL